MKSLFFRMFWEQVVARWREIVRSRFEAEVRDQGEEALLEMADHSRKELATMVIPPDDLPKIAAALRRGGPLRLAIERGPWTEELLIPREAGPAVVRAIESYLARPRG